MSATEPRSDLNIWNSAKGVQELNDVVRLVDGLIVLLKNRKVPHSFYLPNFTHKFFLSWGKLLKLLVQE